MGADRYGAPTTIRQLNVSQHLTCRLRSELVGLKVRGHQLMLLYSLDMLVLQATARPCVGSVYLYTLHSLFSDKKLLLYQQKCDGLPCNLVLFFHGALGILRIFGGNFKMVSYPVNRISACQMNWHPGSQIIYPNDLRV